jgi:hypothetical protein
MKVQAWGSRQGVQVGGSGSGSRRGVQPEASGSESRRGVQAGGPCKGVHGDPGKGSRQGVQARGADKGSRQGVESRGAWLEVHKAARAQDAKYQSDLNPRVMFIENTWR